MAKKQTTINLKGWITQAQYAKDYNVKLSTVSQWVKRARAGKTAYIQFLDVPGIGITLIKPLEVKKEKTVIK
jgi:hypothetical protein